MCIDPGSTSEILQSAEQSVRSAQVAKEKAVKEHVALIAAEKQARAAMDSAVKEACLGAANDLQSQLLEPARRTGGNHSAPLLTAAFGVVRLDRNAWHRPPVDCQYRRGRIARGGATGELTVFPDETIAEYENRLARP